MDRVRHFRAGVVIVLAVAVGAALAVGHASATPGDVLVPRPNPFLGPLTVQPVGSDTSLLTINVSARVAGQPQSAAGAYGFKLYSDGPLTVTSYSQGSDTPCTGILGWTDGGVPVPVGPALDAATVQWAGHVCSGDVSVEVSAPLSTVVWYASAVAGGYESKLRVETVGPGPYVHPCNCVTAFDSHGMGDVVSLT